MQDEMWTYYQRELTYIRKLAKDFARKYPKIANRLLLEESESQDPHVERLLQGFAFLAARVHRKIDDDFPEVTESLLNILYPHYLAPIPSMSIVLFTPDPAQGMLTGGYTIKRHTTLYSRPINGTPCQFRTAYPVTLWPVKVQSLQHKGPDSLSIWPNNAAAVIQIELQCVGDSSFFDLDLGELRFHLNGESGLVYKLYELLFNNVVRVELRDGNEGEGAEPLALPKDALRAVGFDKEEGLLPYPNHSFMGYRLLQEYFTFPEKFFFVDLRHLKLAKRFGKTDKLKILIFLDQAHPQKDNIGKDSFLLGCAPIVNLFQKVAEPINLDRTRAEYHLIPDLRRMPAMEVYSVDRVASTVPYLNKIVHYQPFYSYQHAYDEETGEEEVFWYATRQVSMEKDDPGTEVYLSLVDLKFQPSLPATETLTAHVTCTNRDLPARLPFGNPQGDFELEGAAPITRIRCLKKPTPTYRPPLKGAAQWRLISHLSLNYLSLSGGESARKALQEILKLYDFKDSAVNQQQISGITTVHSDRVVRRVGSGHGGAFARGVKVNVEFDEEKFVGSGVFLLAAVLEKFLGLYVSVNSFSELEITTRQRVVQKKGFLKRWPARAGEQILL